MTRISIKSHSQLVRQGLQNLADEFPKVGRLQIYQVAQRMKARLAKPGAKPTYPIQWDSEKQRKAYFASGGFGRGIPYTRTNAHVAGWQIIKTDNGYRVENPDPTTQYLNGNAYGEIKSRIHIKDNWPIFRDVADDEIAALPEAIYEEISIVARRNGMQ